MNKRTRLIVSLLFIVLIALAVAITQFYLNVPQNTREESRQDEIAKTLDTDRSGFIIFSDGNGGCGIAESGRIVAAPEWVELSFVENERCIAAKKIGGKLKYGCIDYEGNIVVPLIYGSIKKYTAGKMVLYCAVSAEDDTCVIYDQNFIPKFRRPWNSFEIKDDEAVLTGDLGVYVYALSSDELLFKSASVSGKISGAPYNLNIYSRVLLSKLTAPMIEEMCESAGKYIEYAFSGDETLMEDIAQDGLRDFKPFLPEIGTITSKRLVSVSDIHIYSVKSENGVPHYETSVTAEAEIIYIDEYGIVKNSRGEYKAAVEFSGSSESTLKALSGEFIEKFSVETDTSENITAEL